MTCMWKYFTPPRPNTPVPNRREKYTQHRKRHEENTKAHSAFPLKTSEKAKGKPQKYKNK